MADGEYNKSLGLLRLAALWLLILGLIYLARPTPIGVYIGFAIAAVGEFVRFWAAGHLLKTKELVTAGPYRYTRNPLYFGRFLIFTGLCIMAELPYYANWIVLVLGYAVFFIYYMPRKERVEPARLKAEHGEPYVRYFEAVPAFFPTLRPYAQGSNAGWSSERMLRNREHWMVIGLIVIWGLLLWKAYNVPRESEPLPTIGHADGQLTSHPDGGRSA